MVNLRPKAEVDLLEIWDFIFQGSGTDRADAFVDRLLAVCKELEHFPEMGKSRSEFAPQLRSIVERNYLIFYQIVNEKDIDIVRVLHGARDFMALLEDDPDTFR